MPKTKISEFSATPANNTDIDSINISEGCAPSGINDAIRELMAQLKDFQTGAVGDSFNGPVGTSTAAAGAFTTLSSTGNTTLGDASGDSVTINGTATFANANPTLSAGTANGVAYLNGSKVVTSGSALWFDGTNFGVGTGGNTLNHQSVVYKVGANAVYQQIANGSTGLGATNGIRVGLSSAGVGEWYSPTAAISYIDNSEAMRLTSTGLGIGTSSPSQKLDVNGNITSTAWIGRANGSAPSADCAIYRATDNTLGFSTASTERMRLDSSGNLGLGVTPSAWGSDYKALQIGGSATAALSYKNFVTSLSQNVYSTNANDVALVTGNAAKYELNGSGQHVWKTASATAGNAITFTQAATLTENGNYLVGTTTENSGSGGLKVAGQFAVTSSQAFTSSGTVNSTAFYVVCYSLSGTCTLTLPTPSTNVGRVLKIVTQSNQAIVSASSNVTAIASGGLTTSILPATAGKWAELWCDGSYWAIIGTNA